MSPHEDRPGPQLDDLVRRLRAWSSASWQHEHRLEASQRALQLLADDGAAAAGRELRRVPRLHPSAIVDQLEVLARQAERDGADPHPRIAALAAELGFSR